MVTSSLVYRNRKGISHGRDAQDIRPRGQRAQDPAEVARRRLLPAPSGRGGLHRHHPAAQRHGHAAHGPCARRLHPGRHRAPSAHARPLHPLDPGHRPRRHRHPDQGRQEAQGRGQKPPRDGPRRLHRRLLGLDARVRRHHPESDPPHGLLRRLRGRALHHGRRVRRGRAPRVLRLVPRRAHLPRQAHRQLVPQLHHGHLGRRGRVPRRARPSVAPALPADRAGERAGLHRRRHHAPRDHARRHRRGRLPEGPQEGRLRGQDRAPAHRRPRDPHLRGLACRRRLRLRLREGHARPRPQRLRHGRGARPAQDQHLRRARGRRGRLRRVLRHDARRVPRGRRGVVRGARPARSHRGARPLRHALLPLRHHARALAVRAVVRGRRQAQGAGDRGRDLGQGALQRGALEAELPHLDGEPEGLVHLPPAVVGPPHPRVLLRGLRLGGRPHGGRRRVPEVRQPPCAPGRERARHLVQLAVVDLRHAGLAAAPRAARGPSPHDGARHRPRHHRPVGGAHGHELAVLPGRGALPRRGHLPDDPR